MSKSAASSERRGSKTSYGEQSGSGVSPTVRAQREHMEDRAEVRLMTTRTNAIRQDLAPHTPARAPFRVPVRHGFEFAAKDAVRLMRESASGLTAKEHDLLNKFSQGQYLTGVFRLAEIGQKCEDISGATAFPEAWRGLTVKHHPQAHVCVLDAFGTESMANGAFDADQIAYAANPTEENRQRALESGQKQLMETYRALNALHRR